MFICAGCKKLSKPRDPSTLVVIETRKRIYVNVDGESIGEGWEIANELRCCRECGAASAIIPMP